MPSASTLLAFTLAAAVLVAIPGPNLMFIAARSAADGRRAGVLSSLGVETGTMLHVAAAAIGLSALLASSAEAFAVVKYAGAAYLVYMGLKALLSRAPAHAPDEDAGTARVAGAHVYRQAVLVQLLNPKVAVFFLAFLPQFVDPDRAAVPQILMLGAILSTLGMTVNLIAAMAADGVARRVRGTGRSGRPWGRWAGGCVYLGLGAYAAAGPGRPAQQ